MAALFNNINNGSPVTGSTEISRKPDVTSGDSKTDAPFASALDSIGVAIGELRDGVIELKGSIGNAVQASLESDRTNQALYDAVASAIYDSLSAYYSDHPTEDKESSKDSDSSVGAKLYDGRGYTRSELLHIDKPSVTGTNSSIELKSIISSMRQVSEKDESVSKLPVSKPITNDEASDKKRIKDLQINFLSNRLPNYLQKADRFMDRGNLAFQKIIDGNFGYSTRDTGGSGGILSGLLGTLGSIGAVIASLGTFISGRGLLNIAKSVGGHMLGKIGVALPALRKIPMLGKLFRGETDRIAKEAAKKAAKRAGDRAAKEVASKGGGKLAQTVARKTAANAAEKAALKAGLEKSASGASKKAITAATNKAAREAGKNVVKKGIAKTAAKTVLSSGAKLAGKTALKLIPGIGVAATLADVGYTAAGAIVDHASAKAGQNVQEMQATNLETFATRHADDPNGEAKSQALARTQAANEALRAARSGFGGQVWADEKKANRALELYKKYRSGEEVMKGAKGNEDGGIPDHELAKKAAVDSLGFFTTSETKELAAALIEKYDADLEWKDLIHSTSGKNNVNEASDGTSGNEESTGTQETGYNVDFVNGSNASALPAMAPGSMIMRQDNTITAGEGVSTNGGMSLEEQMQQTRQVTTESFKEALTSPEVCNMFMQVSLNAGKSVEQQLMG